jgi:hypothetical protein
MQSVVRIFCFYLIWVLLGTAICQTKADQPRRTFENKEIGLTYAFPEGLDPTPADQLPRDPNGREHIILALWDKPRHAPVPRIVFLYDAKAAPATLTTEEIAVRYLHSLKPGEGYKMSEPQKTSMAGNTMWRMDYWRPDDSGQSFNSAIVIPFKDKRLLFVQMNAASQRELDSIVGSLHELRFDSR